MSHDRKHPLNDSGDHVGISGAVENDIVTFDNQGFPKDSGLKKDDAGTTVNDIISANQVDTRILNKAIEVYEKGKALGFYLSLLT